MKAIIIPAYKPSNSLLQVVADIIEQTNFDIVVINDGSGASFTEVFEKVSAESRVHLLVHEQNPR